MKKLYIIAALFLSSCSKDFLDKQPQQNTDLNSAFVDMASGRASLNGMYSLMKGVNYYGRSLYVTADLLSDNAYLSSSNSKRYLQFDSYTTNSTNGDARNMWNTLYQVVVNANLMIQSGNKLQVGASDSTEKAQIMGEAYAVRALAYFDLMKLFAQPYNFTADGSHLGVPLVTETTADAGAIISPARDQAAKVYAQIEADLVKAVGLIPATPVGYTLSSNKGRISLYGAKALLARLYLYEGKWADAETQTTDIITANKYSLLAKDKLATDFQLENNGETIFEILYLTTDNLGTDAMVNFCLQGGSYGDMLATDDLYNGYEATDVRRSFVVKGKRSGAENPAILINKYQNKSTYLEGMKVVRLAEVYLTRAEARKMQGKDALAAADVDVIRTRALGTVAPTTATGDALLTIIKNERRKELCFEGHRLFDLTRWKQSFTKFKTGGATLSITYPNNKTILPIPLDEINANPNIAGQQNPDY
ncbi:SusD family protein [Chitinophaga jiangningensis]|uniref:SusD family protein n=1 Tax=Chitinophaga jiangningensis TaxID=1419482 RepID=A0A1M7M9K1_9BACT|nr:RagB/SusD family nutrient uptake outer membrane protein [Chitinophaga jiangningensis]SHM87392.1 SusD family protein [Chitinophaga jiangningensis]